ncbi:dihydroorotase-like cyclic amidohydrolase [Streptomyces sp. 3330]|uniref:amidohydrolase family protein n=1 Tax=Streptomyces sp. 3330 TaxID=2817755 RepID=UPI0028648067|nr:amidohydrolase family protein [Streptomyces sp. 3330]MDR6974299.1 dihydroorotase-like cyclic amidohydrolase [Streptomyces sp. 3330]
MLDTVIERARVIDPETGLDDVLNIGIHRGRITHLTASPLDALTRIDATGLVACPGFIDLHSHAQDLTGLRLQALDGVTTALELEAGAGPVSALYRQAADEGRPIHYGYSASWAAARMAVLADTPMPAHTVLKDLGNPAWQRHATRAETVRITQIVETQLAEGAIGIGMLLGYCAGAGTAEFHGMAELARAHSMTTFTHIRELRAFNPAGPVDGVEELVRVALDSGAHLHCCHVNSTARSHIDAVTEALGTARDKGAVLTTEAYPYATAMTPVGAPFLAPDLLKDAGLDHHAVKDPVTGRPLPDTATLRRLRRDRPETLVLFEPLRETGAAQRDLLERALFGDHTAVASDAMPTNVTPSAWPPPEAAPTHPRGAGTFSRTLRLFAGTASRRTLSEVIARMTLVPADIAAAGAPSLRTKGRIRIGCDADITIFDQQAVTERASFATPLRASTGITHVLVAGRLVVCDGELDTAALPGRAIRNI